MKYGFWQFLMLLAAGLFMAACSAFDTSQSVDEPVIPTDVVSTDASKDAAGSQSDALNDAMKDVSPLADGAPGELPRTAPDDALLDGKANDEVEVVADSGPGLQP